MRSNFLVVLLALAWSDVALAEEARVHVLGGAAHAVGGTQGHEFGPGAGGSGSVELAVGNVVGVQASAGAIVLAPGRAPSDPTVAKQSTGTALVGTVGVRFRPLGAFRVGGLWLDANGGIAQTGSQPRIALDAHLGWDVRVAGRVDVGPFVGFTQIMQPDATFRPDDAHILWAGIQVSLGATEPPRSGVLPSREPAPTVRDRDGVASASDRCPPLDERDAVPEGCPVPEVKRVGDLLVVDDVIHFEFDSPRILPPSYPLVQRVAAFIEQNPAILELSVEGHADASGSDAYNLRLSEARAESTRALLVRSGVDEQRLRVVGYGKSRLKVATERPDARNRRVEFIVTRSDHPTADSHLLSPSPAIAAGRRDQP